MQGPGSKGQTQLHWHISWRSAMQIWFPINPIIPTVGTWHPSWLACKLPTSSSTRCMLLPCGFETKIATPWLILCMGFFGVLLRLQTMPMGCWRKHASNTNQNTTCWQKSDLPWCLIETTWCQVWILWHSAPRWTRITWARSARCPGLWQAERFTSRPLSVWS